MQIRVNLGAYPDDPYYDPNRPSWLPYWLDTPTESVRKWTGYSPSAADLKTRQIEEIAKTDPELASRLLLLLAEQEAEKKETQIPWWIWPAGLAVGALVLISVLRR